MSLEEGLRCRQGFIRPQPHTDHYPHRTSCLSCSLFRAHLSKGLSVLLEMETASGTRTRGLGTLPLPACMQAGLSQWLPSPP